MNNATVTFEDNYVQIKSSASDVLTSSCIHSNLSVAMSLCVDYACRRILALAEQPSGSGLNCESIAEAMNRLVILRGVKLACCYFDGVKDNLRAYTAQVAATHGMTVQFFSDREEALEWLGAK